MENDLQSIFAMLQDIQRTLFTCATRGNVSRNYRAELLHKINWLKDEIDRLA